MLRLLADFEYCKDYYYELLLLIAIPSDPSVRSPELTTISVCYLC